jgi:hypothetical protein
MMVWVDGKKRVMPVQGERASWSFERKVVNYFILGNKD